MDRGPRRIKLAPDSELSARIREAEAVGCPLQVDTGEGVYELTVRRASCSDHDAGSEVSPASEPASALLSPQAFFAEAIGRDDLAEILRRLAQ